MILTGMDADVHGSARSLLQPIFMSEVVNRWRPKTDRIVREDDLRALVPSAAPT
ncbi:hypothetical protein ACVBEH_06790 [Roseateles sp. GG27B]